jgi:cytochrome P450
MRNNCETDSRPSKLNSCSREYETGQEQLIMTPFPSLLARKPYQARGRIQQSLRRYFRNKSDENSDVSLIIKHRAETNRKWGLPIDDIADHELGMLFVAVTNAIPTMFWMVVYIFRDPQLVADLQEELAKVVAETKTKDGARECTFDVSSFLAACPLLNSVYREVMRLTNRQMGTRIIMEDIVVSHKPADDNNDNAQPRQYLLKKDSTVFMPAVTLNFAEPTWGKDVDQFDARRFLNKSREQDKLQNRAAAPFGGGKHLCPGRHFAYAEILGTVAALVVGFEIETPEGGRVAVPGLNNNMVEAVAKPLPAVQNGMLARVRRRPGWEDVRWGFKV